MIKNYIALSFFLGLSIFPLLSFCQNVQDDSELYKWFDQQISVENTRILNGVEYVEKHRSINEKNKFFVNSDASPGSVLYDGQWFPDLPIRYNVFDDLLVAQIESGLGITILHLIKDKIGRFKINNYNFINVKPGLSSNSAVQGFYEILMETSQLKILKKHHKKIIEKRDRQVAYFEFENIEGHYAFFYRDTYHLLKSRRDLIAQFPKIKDEINNYYQTHSSLLRAQPDQFMIQLFKEINTKLAVADKVSYP